MKAIWYPMKTILFISFLVLAVSCSVRENATAPVSLYKTEEGENISHKSYDQSMKLWDVKYVEDYIETDYGKSHVIVSGKDEGRELILIPGLFADACMWYPNVGALSEHFKVYTLDMMNYGGKSEPAGKAISTIEDYKIWIGQIINHYKMDKPMVAGLSYSSWLALALAREMPEQFGSIVLLDPSETFMPMNGGIAWKGFKYFMFFPNRAKYARFFDWIGGGYTNDQMDIWSEHMLDVIEFGSVKMFDVPQHRIYKPEELTMVRIPVLIMAGGKPILYDDPEEFRANALKAIPHAKVIIVPDAGHGLNMEKPGYVNKVMIEFLSKGSVDDD